VRRLVVVGIGTVAFGMADILLEPYGGQVLHFTVGATTKLTALLALGGLLGFSWASHVLGRGGDPYRMTQVGVLIGLPGFLLVILSAPIGIPWVFLVGNFMIGFGGAVFGHGTLTFTMNATPKDQAGLALGAWGAVQATGAGLGIALSGAIRDLVNAAMGATQGPWGLPGAASGYITVYGLEITLLVVTVIATVPLIRRGPAPRVPDTQADRCLDLEEGATGPQTAEAAGRSV
jgi:BCD family chlorophyll transporter-like MFS transporter